jgi:hypothetical protein
MNSDRITAGVMAGFGIGYGVITVGAQFILSTLSASRLMQNLIPSGFHS